MKGRVISRLILVGTMGAAVAWLALHRELLNGAALHTTVRQFGPVAPIFFILLYALGAVLFVPGSALTAAGGALFGPVWGTLWNLIGATSGATLAFVIARYLASDWVAAQSGERLGRLMRGVEEEGWRFVAFVRLVPLFVQSRELCLRTNPNPSSRVTRRLVCVHGAGRAGLYLSGLRRTRGGFWTNRGSQASSARFDAICGGSFPAAADSPVQGSALHRC